MQNHFQDGWDKGTSPDICAAFNQETIGPDPHTPGSELPPSVYAADIGYLVDGTPLDAAGNNTVHWVDRDLETQEWELGF